MKRSIVAVVLTVLLFSILVFTSLHSGIDLQDSQFLQLDSKLIYVIVSAFALGALFLFLLISILPIRGSRTIQKLTASVPVPVSTKISEVEAAIQLGEFDEAEELLSEMRSEEPDHWYARKLAGDLELRKGNEKLSEQHYQDGLKIAGGRARALLFLNLAQLWEQQDRIDPAKDLYKEILQLVPTASEPLFRLRSMAIREQDWRTALYWQEQLEHQSWKGADTPEETGMKIGIRYELAQSEYESGNAQTAQALLKFILRMTDSFTPAFLLSGEIQASIENSSAALKIWERGLQNTQNPVLLRRIGEFYLSRNLPEKAIEFFRNAVLQHPEEHSFEFCLGELYLKMEMIEEARRVFEKIEEKYPGWILNQAVLAEIYEKLGNQKEASRTLRRILDSSEAQAVLPWSCYTCNTTYPAYRSFCFECLEWNSLNFNQNQAGNLDFRYVESTASPP